MSAPATAPRAEGALMTLEGVGKQYAHAAGIFVLDYVVSLVLG